MRLWSVVIGGFRPEAVDWQIRKQTFNRAGRARKHEDIDGVRLSMMQCAPSSDPCKPVGHFQASGPITVGGGL